MQAKETMQTHSTVAVPQVAKTGELSTLRAWHTPTFEREPLKKALSGEYVSSGPDNVYYS